jgi:hypothetical protein
MELFLISIAVAVGADLRRVGALGLLLHFPAMALVVAGLTLVRSDRKATDSTVGYCDAVAAELRAGSSLRQGLSAAALSMGDRNLADRVWETGVEGLPDVVAAAFPDMEREMSAAIRSGLGSGGPMAGVFDGLASVAMATEEMGREVRVATAPARAASTLFMLAPTAYLAMRWDSLDRLFARPEQRFAAAVGAAMFLTGLLISLILVRRAR